MLNKTEDFFILYVRPLWVDLVAHHLGSLCGAVRSVNGMDDGFNWCSWCPRHFCVIVSSFLFTRAFLIS